MMQIMKSKDEERGCRSKFMAGFPEAFRGRKKSGWVAQGRHAARGYYSANPSSACVLLFSPTCFLFPASAAAPCPYLPRHPLPEKDREEPLPPSLLSMSLDEGAEVFGRMDRDPLPRVTPLTDLSVMPWRVKRPLYPLLPEGWNDLSCVRGAMNGFPLEPPPPLPRSGARCMI
jgi:hypothetical protein